MSLISQALRKAQHDRTPKRMSQADGQGAETYVNAVAKGMNPALVIGLILLVVLLAGLVAGLSIVLFKGYGRPAAVSSEAVDEEPADSTTLSTVESDSALTTPVDPQITPPALNEKLDPTPSHKVVDELREARKSSEAAAAEAEAVQDAAAPASEAIIEWLGQARLSGVKISATSSKVILNDKAYAVGDYVNFKLGIKVMLIQETRVLFVDNKGKKYLKRL